MLQSQKERRKKDVRIKQKRMKKERERKRERNLVEEGVDVFLFSLLIPIKLFVIKGLFGVKDPVEDVEKFTRELWDAFDAQLDDNKKEFACQHLEIRLEVTF